MNKIFLDRNENNYGPAPACLEVAENPPTELFYQYSTDYRHGFKSALSEKLSEIFHLPEKQVLLGYGAEDLLKQVIQSHLAKGEKLLIPNYSWWYYKEIANEVNGISIEYPLIEGEDTFYYDIEKLLLIYESEKPDITFISSPNNPTGNSISKEDLLFVLDKLSDTTVVLDQAYWLSSDNSFAAELVNKYDNLIIIQTFSKLYALAGIRIGFALVGKKHELLTKLSNRYLGYNRISEKIALAAIDSTDYYNEVSEKISQDRKLYFEELNKLPGFNVYKSDANFVLVKIPKEIKTSLNDFLKERGIIIKFMNEELLNSHLRITIGTQEENRIVIDEIKSFTKQRINELAERV